MSSTTIVTELSEFFKSVGSNGETRYYPRGSTESRSAAMGFDAKGDPAPVKGFAVYDTTIATQYAVELYPTKVQADEHKASCAPETPMSAVGDSARSGEPDAYHHVPEKPAPKSRSKRGRGKPRG